MVYQAKSNILRALNLPTEWCYANKEYEYIFIFFLNI
jgi:hypothetical protein